MAKNIYSVGQVNAYIKRMFAQDWLLHSIAVRGEVSNCKYHSSGHIYFTLKDASGTLSCIMFAGRRRGLSFPMKEGDQVVVTGTVDVYERGGSYQLYAEQIIRDGVGLLNERYELLKKKLEEMGMFDEQYKQPIPKYIRRLGVVTAPTGAAVRDIISIARRRNPCVQIILFPAIVQGDEAPRSIVSGIYALDHMRFDADGNYLGVLPADEGRDAAQRLSGLDAIIIGRGGGSLEDLWAFNEEIVAEAVFECGTPVISAVGHETDTVITDYVADLRAPTPSAAAELAVYELSQYISDLEGYREALLRRMNVRIAQERSILQRCQRELYHLSPMQQVRQKRMHALQLQERMEQAMQHSLRGWRMRLPSGDLFTAAIQRQISRARQGLSMQERLEWDMQAALDQRRHTLQLLAARLEANSPVAKLSGSYGFISDPDGKGIGSIRQVRTGDTLLIRLKDGRIRAAAQETEPLS